jgi:hypothetical protein
MREMRLSGSMSGNRNQSHAKPDCGAVCESRLYEGHRETTATAPVLDSTQLASAGVLSENLISSAMLWKSPDGTRRKAVLSRWETAYNKENFIGGYASFSTFSEMAPQRADEVFTSGAC